ncbi:MAG: zf-TFIIB domain-containing protein [Pseudomonadota bacterium]
MAAEKVKVTISDKQCPICSENLISGKYKDVHIDGCKKCKGLWFDQGELEKVLNKKVISPEMFRFNRNRVETKICHLCGKRNDSKEFSCIKCKGILENLTCLNCKSKMSEYTHENIFIDFCQTCAAYWLDNQELIKIFKTNPNFDRIDMYQRDISTKGYTNIDIVDIQSSTYQMYGAIRILGILF